MILEKKGGHFLLETADLTTFYSAELKSEESKMIQQAVQQFLQNEIESHLEEMESLKGIELTPALLEKCGKLGFLGLEVSEKFGGTDLSLKEVLHFVESISKGYSFAGALGVQTSIGIAPILLYGSEYLKEKYIPKMMEGTVLSAFALTEPNAGSDANAGKTKATKDKEGNYIITGQKAWISNAGIADIFIVFAKIENDENLSAFVVEKNCEGVALGPEEKKMGLSGWSTCQVFLENVKVSKNHLLGERNKGLKIALNTLNTGRIKLGASCLGVGKSIIQHSVTYAIQREQFGKSISEFGAIQDKIARMAFQIFANEAVVYRVANDIDLYRKELFESGVEFSKAKIEALKEYSIECAIAKVFGSEVQDYIVDQGVQIYGGMGFSAESPVERLYRSARISRIFEGTNEINRLVIIKEFLKKGMTGDVDIFTSFTEALAQLEVPAESFDNDILEQHQQYVQNLKSLTIIAAGVCAQKFMAALSEEQEISMHIADLLIHVHVIDSTVLRIRKLQQIDQLETNIHYPILKAIAFDIHKSVSNNIIELMACFDNKNDASAINLAFHKYGKFPHCNIKEDRRTIAKFMINQGTYNLG